MCFSSISNCIRMTPSVMKFQLGVVHQSRFISGFAKKLPKPPVRGLVGSPDILKFLEDRGTRSIVEMNSLRFKKTGRYTILNSREKRIFDTSIRNAQKDQFKNRI